jgi:hypothetical protein
MPFSKTTEEHSEDYWTKHFESFLKPLIEENSKVVARRSQPLRGDVLREIITEMVTAPVVVADITDAKPNVYWELGVRQSFKHGTVTIAEEGTPLPFDLGAKGTLFYSDERFKHGEFTRNFKTAIQDCIEHPERPDSHVLEALSGRGSLFEVFRKDETIRRLDGLESELVWNLGLLNYVQDDAARNLTKKKATEMVMSAARMRSSSIELLVTNRYIEESRDFYNQADLCFSDAILLIVTSGYRRTLQHSLGLFPSLRRWLLAPEKRYCVSDKRQNHHIEETASRSTCLNLAEQPHVRNPYGALFLPPTRYRNAKFCHCP